MAWHDLADACFVYLLHAELSSLLVRPHGPVFYCLMEGKPVGFLSQGPILSWSWSRSDFLIPLSRQMKGPCNINHPYDWSFDSQLLSLSLLIPKATAYSQKKTFTCSHHMFRVLLCLPTYCEMRGFLFIFFYLVDEMKCQLLLFCRGGLSKYNQGESGTWSLPYKP